MKKVSWIAICMAVSVGLLFAFTPAYAAKTIKIGLVDCYSGGATTFTYDVRDAFKMAMDNVNAKGGILGQKVEITTRDTKFKVDIGLNVTKELVMREGVDILVGTINSSVALAIGEIVKDAKIPFFCTFSKSAKITGEKGQRYVFGITEHTTMVGKAAARGLAEKPYIKYWIAGDDYEYGHALGDGVWTNLKKFKPDVKLIGQSWWKVGEPELTPYLTAIMAAKPDAVIFATGGASMVNIMKASKATGFSEKIPMFVHTATELSTLMPLGQEAPADVLGTSNYYFYYPETPENKAFVEEFQKVYNRYPRVGALYGYLTAQYIIKGFEKAGKIDTEKLIDALEGFTVDSPVGPVEMRACDHQAQLPMFMGVTKKSPDYPFFIASEIKTIPGPETMPTCEEIKALRSKK
ncbi:MAG TPA: ABC transporter substrate-binding protein [Desulfobacteraceae bacterium]|nr:ABC transporter substrate-binding protein [Desulfobacteraceae bacterium]HPJ68151.1 ABC transporter substrate-binding protein [Desulfobacteraceae bacterium]HPQ28943.1 ABC transporter substrate-binding protein [Desulfobacteraceae bacterium]